MARVSRRRRSQAAVKGWETRRARARARSQAAKKGWKTRNKRFYLKRQRDTKPKTKPAKTKIKPEADELGDGAIRDYVISLSYRGKKGSRHVDFVASATSREEALEQLHEEKPWTEKIPWQKISIHKGPIVKESHALLTRLETKSRKRRKTTKRK